MLGHYKLMSVLLADGPVAKWFRPWTYQVTVSHDRRFDSRSDQNIKNYFIIFDYLAYFFSDIK